ncbi:coiled-coil domain-containing protein [Actinomadura macrotermitis]|uniref:Uncharacterized protein n=1 Tax=Actinomadura macrotermitis TaxID=2585200 RepID=A0A7K0BQG4_9ACTN|nr:hypothetical protein [Actinomadura macrotermitis]MQY02974.1 hypothetical protein [Actinomadura macrotermitis]
MARDEVDAALRYLRDEKERISATLLDLEDHQGYRLLSGASLTGETARLQTEVRTRTLALWDLFDRYSGTLGAAEELRARHNRPGQPVLAELTRLLTGPSVELPAKEVPLEQRTLLAAPAETRLTLKDAVARMTALFEESARMVAGVDAVWSALLTALEEAEADRRAVAGLAAGLGESDPGLARLGAELDAAGAVVRTDPLSLSHGGRPDTTRLVAARTALAGLRGRLEEAVRLRDGFAARCQEVQDLIGRVREAERRAYRARDEVLVKIAAPVLPDIPILARALDERLAGLRQLPGRRSWQDLAALAADLERAAGDALARTEEAAALITGLLDRREELRGRLEAYRVKAARLGHAEDAELAELYDRARGLLWTSPCDLRKATMTLSGYQQAISSRAKGTER